MSRRALSRWEPNHQEESRLAFRTGGGVSSTACWGREVTLPMKSPASMGWARGAYLRSPRHYAGLPNRALRIRTSATR